MDGLPDRLASARKKTGLSQAALAKKLRVSAGAVGRWEAGFAKPETKRLHEIAELLNTTTDFLLAGKEIRASHASADPREMFRHVKARLDGFLPRLNDLEGESRRFVCISLFHASDAACDRVRDFLCGLMSEKPCALENYTRIVNETKRSKDIKKQ